MQKKSTRQSAFFSPRALIALLLCAATCSIATGTLLAFLRPQESAKVSNHAIAALTFEERVAYQRAIEEVYWRHRIWPKERPEPKPSLDAVMSQAQLEKKVADYLRKSQALEDYWQRPITAQQLQAEMDRMAQHTKQPDVLQELFDASGNDPFVIAECLARPALSERLVTNWYANEREPMDSSRVGAENQTPNVTAAATANYALPTISDGAVCVDDTWTATSTTNAPTGRLGHTAVWTGSEMIIWGGRDLSFNFFDTGGKYNPSTNSWMATTTTNAPSSRYSHTAVWTGSEMIVWGGLDENFFRLNTGGRYNPTTDSWTVTSTINAPDGRSVHTAVWTGSQMIVWGGYSFDFLNTGGRYDPGTDSWTATSIANTPDAREAHTAVWAGSQMIVWGGFSGCCTFNTGGRYNPGTNSWVPTSIINAPDGRSGHTAVWSGSEMIIWGGAALNTGGRYNPNTDSWTATRTNSAPSGRELHTAVWTGSEMIVWGGEDANFVRLNTGGRYNAGTNSWTRTSTINAPVGRASHTAVWTDNEMVVWGGANDTSNFNTGGRYFGQSGSPPITLSAAGRKVGGINTVRLTWSGASSANIDVYRNAVLIVTTANDGTYTDSTGDTGRAQYRYKVCEAGTQTCSNNARVTFQQ